MGHFQIVTMYTMARKRLSLLDMAQKKGDDPEESWYKEKEMTQRNKKKYVENTYTAKWY